MTPIKSEAELEQIREQVRSALFADDFPILNDIEKDAVNRVLEVILSHERQHERELEKYQELLYAVESKYPDETRHQTALRYIKNAELGNNTTLASNQEGENL